MYRVVAASPDGNLTLWRTAAPAVAGAPPPPCGALLTPLTEQEAIKLEPSLQLRLPVDSASPTESVEAFCEARGLVLKARRSIASGDILFVHLRRVEVDEDWARATVVRSSNMSDDFRSLKEVCSSLPGIDGWIYFSGSTAKEGGEKDLDSEIAVCNPRECMAYSRTLPSIGSASEALSNIGLPSLTEYMSRNAKTKELVDDIAHRFQAQCLEFHDGRMYLNFY